MLRIYLFGHLRVYLDDQLQNFSALPKANPLWAYLLLHRNEPIARNRLAALLWPDGSESEARANLRRHLHELRRILPPEEDGLPWLQADTQTVQWNPDCNYWLDIEEFEALSSQTPVIPQHLAAAVALYTGDLLQELYDDWLFFERERLRTLFFDDLGLLIQHHRARGEYAQAIAYAQQLLQHDVMREDIVRELMLCRFEAGDRAGALQEYRRFEQRLREEMDVAPMVETRALYDSIAHQIVPVVSTPVHESPVPVAASESEPVERPPGNLPAQLTSFIGREEEVAILRNMLTGTRTGVRLLSLTGPGGSGKSRLALEVASRLRMEQPELFPGGCFFVPLATVASGAAVLPLIAETLGVREQPGQSLLASVQEYLRPRRLLLLLDNFEHVIEAAPLVLDLLRSAPGLQIMVTSRAVLRLYGEQEFAVAPLPLPELAEMPSAEEIARSPAVMLFMTRSRAVNPTFVLNDDNAAVIADICTRLDGLPLAIELAAARSKLLSPRSLLEKLQNRLAFLADRSRTAQERHQTLRTTLDWSYHLLSTQEKTLFVRLAVFAGSFGLEAAETVCNVDQDLDLLDALESLVDNSLVQQSSLDAEGFESSHEPRFRLLSTVQEYALELFEAAPEAERVREHHLLYYVALAERSEDELRAADQASWMARMGTEHNNFRAALQWALLGEGQRLVWGVQLAAALGHYWYIDGHLMEGERWLDEAYRKGGASAPPDIRAKALYALGVLRSAQGDQRIAPTFEEALDLFEQVGNQRGRTDAMYMLARLHLGQGEVEQAEQMLDEVLALARQLGYGYPAAFSLNSLAAIATRRGDFVHASELFEQALATANREKDKLTAAYVLTAMGETARLRGDYPQAERYYQEAMKLAVEMHQRSREMMLMHNLAYIALQRGETRRAASLFSECARLGMELPDRVNLGMCLIGLGSVASMESDARRAGVYFGAGEMVLESMGAHLDPADEMEYRHYRLRVERQVQNQDFAPWLARGRSLTMDAAQDLALRGASLGEHVSKLPG